MFLQVENKDSDQTVGCTDLFESLLYAHANFNLMLDNSDTGADPGFLIRGFICITEWGFALLILSHFS